MAQHLAASMDSPWWTCRTTKLQHFLYQCKPAPGEELSTQQKRRYARFRNGRHLLYAAIVLFAIRLLYLVGCINTGDSFEEHQPFNPLMVILMEKYNFFNSPNLVIVDLSVAIFTIAIDYLVCFQADHFIYRLGHQLMIENGQQMLELNKSRLGVRPSLIDCRKAHQWLLQWVRLLRAIWQSDELRFSGSQLNDFPCISRRLRARLVLYSATIEFTFAFIWVFLTFIGITLEVSFLAMVSSASALELSTCSLLILLSDFSFLVYCALNVIRVAFLSIHYGLVLAFVTHHYIGELNLGLCQSFRRSPLAIIRQLNHLYREHNRLLYIAEYTDKLFVSPLFCVMFFTVISLSSVTISCLLFMKLLFFEKCLILLYNITSLAVPLFGCASLISWSQAFCKPEPVLYQAQLLLGNRPLAAQRQVFLSRSEQVSAKVKLMLYYEAICTRKPFYFTLGFLGNISKRSLFEFGFTYSTLVMFLSTMIRDKRTVL